MILLGQSIRFAMPAEQLKELFRLLGIRLLGSLVMEGVYYFLSWRVFSDLTFHTQGFKPAIVLPLVCLLFAYLAARAVFRDELLVRAADRIR